MLVFLLFYTFAVLGAARPRFTAVYTFLPGKIHSPCTQCAAAAAAPVAAAPPMPLRRLSTTASS